MYAAPLAPNSQPKKSVLQIRVQPREKKNKLKTLQSRHLPSVWEQQKKTWQIVRFPNKDIKNKCKLRSTNYCRRTRFVCALKVPKPCCRVRWSSSLPSSHSHINATITPLPTKQNLSCWVVSRALNSFPAEVGEFFCFSVCSTRLSSASKIDNLKERERKIKTHETESKLHERLIKRILFGGSAESKTIKLKRFLCQKKKNEKRARHHHRWELVKRKVKETFPESKTTFFSTVLKFALSFTHRHKITTRGHL